MHRPLQGLIRLRQLAGVVGVVAQLRAVDFHELVEAQRLAGAHQQVLRAVFCEHIPDRCTARLHCIVLVAETAEDERQVRVRLTRSGRRLREKANVDLGDVCGLAPKEFARLHKESSPCATTF